MFKKFLSVALLVAVALFATDVDAKYGGRGGGGFGGRSGSSIRSTPSPSRGSTRSPSIAPRTRTTAPRPKPSGTQTKTSGARTNNATKSTVKRSPTQQKSYEKAKSQGKAFGSKKAAVSDFKSKAKSDPKTQAALAKSHPTTFDKEPATRPSYVPQSYNNQTVVFNNGGYGYYGAGGGWNALHTYMLLDTMSDVAMMNAMSHQGYYYDTPAVHTTTHVRTGPSVAVVVVSSVLVIIVVGAAVIFILRL
jgi:hypothetical protein